MTRPSKYPPELRERAVRLVFASKEDYASEFEAIRAIAAMGDRVRPRRCKTSPLQAEEVHKRCTKPSRPDQVETPSGACGNTGRFS